jgi:hypothetical protein
MLGRYRRCLWLDARKYLHQAHGVGWPKQVKGGNTKAIKDADTVHDILWQSAQNNLFEYLLGSRLIFFCFPARYCIQAKRGI